MKKTIEIKKEDYQNLSEMRNFVKDEIEKMCTNDVVEIITNGNLASVIQDFQGYDLSNFDTKLEKDENGRAKNFPMGKIFEKQIYVNPYMRWDDDRILFKIDDNNINELEIIDKTMMLI